MAERIINTPEELDLWIKFLLGRKLPITVSSIDGRDRTGQQNKLMWLWASEAAQQLGDRTADELQRQWKLMHGVPILREESADFRETYDTAIKPLPYALKLKAMHFIPVTSEMRVKQMVRFLDAISQECAENGIVLTEPDPALASYQSRYRMKEAA
jgi:hypothetical protein